MDIVSGSSVYQGVIGIAAFSILYYVYWELTTGTSRRRMISKHGCKPVKKFPIIDPILGLDFFFKNRRAVSEHRMLATTWERFQAMATNTYQITLMGQTVDITIDAENLKAMQSLQFKHFGLPSRRISTFTTFLGPGIFSTDGAQWQHSRDMLRPNFARNQVSDLKTLDVNVDHLIRAIPRDGSTFDLQELFFKLTIDSATHFLFGESTNCLAPGSSTVAAAKFAESFVRGQEVIGQILRWGPLGVFYPRRQFRADCNYVQEFVDDFVEKGLAHAKLSDAEKDDDRYVFCYELVKQTRDKVQIRSELLNILLAGRDTTASLLSDLWFELARRPEIFAKLRAEVNTLEGEKPTASQIKDMKYLRFVLNECLRYLPHVRHIPNLPDEIDRLHPVVPSNSRQANADVVLPRGGGPDGKSPILIPKGRVVGWSVYSMHRRKDYYGEDAEEFKPERWESLRPGWEYLPFNGGPRICLGQQFALTEASYTTIRLIQEFKAVESRDDRPWTEWLTLTCTGRYGAKVSLTPA
ncbi:hypothetical protein MMC13_005837 [Lambiella insularis]|nr:hypothetical protein [Lambiella insularis]